MGLVKPVRLRCLRSPGGVDAAWCGTDRGAGEDLAYGPGADLVAESEEFTFPSAKAMRAMRDRTRELTKSRSTLYLDLDELLLRLNRSLRGWANYFRHGSSSRHFQQIDYHAWKRIGSWIRRKHHPISWGEVRRRFSGPGSRFTYNGVTFSGASSVKIVDEWLGQVRTVSSAERGCGSAQPCVACAPWSLTWASNQACSADLRSVSVLV